MKLVVPISIKRVKLKVYECETNSNYTKESSRQRTAMNKSKI